MQEHIWKNKENKRALWREYSSSQKGFLSRNWKWTTEKKFRVP